MAERPRVITRQDKPTNAGFRLASTERLRHTRGAYARLLEQMLSNDAGAVAVQNVTAYIRELDEALASRAAAPEAA